jgi:hypothetical protein
VVFFVGDVSVGLFLLFVGNVSVDLFLLFIGDVPVVAHVAMVGAKAMDRQAVLVFRKPRRVFGILFGIVANLVLVAHPALWRVVWGGLIFTAHKTNLV